MRGRLSYRDNPDAPRRPDPASVRAVATGFVLGAVLVGVAGCLDLGALREVAFPPTVPGLDGDRAWQHVPVGVWMTEGEVAPVALAICAPPGCGQDATVGVFRAGGASAGALLAESAEPSRLVAAVSEPRRPAPRGRPRLRAAITTEPLHVGRFNGVVLKLSRPDGSHRAFGVALAAERSGAVVAVIVLAPREDDARRIARNVAAALG